LNQSLYLVVNKHSRGKRANSRHSNEIFRADAIGDSASTGRETMLTIKGALA
jgi:hypothetical protein